MPTGYTAKLIEKGQEFPEFVMQCARAFGALIDMRDDPMDAPIPNEFRPSGYHVEALARAKAELERLSTMTPDEQIKFGEGVRDDNLNQWAKSEAKEADENARIDAMVAKINKWVPPTGDHVALKEFMLDQLRISRHDVNWTRNYHNGAAKTPVGYFRAALEQAERGIKYHTEEMAKDEQRAKDRTEWVRKLRESIK